MSRLKDSLLAGFACTSLVLAVVVWRQQRELTAARLAPAVARAAAVTIHAAHTEDILLPPGRSERFAGEPRSIATLDPDDPGARRLPLLEPRARKPRGLAKLVENPEFLHALGVQRQAMLDARFAALFRQLNLREDELAAFKQLLAEKESVALDVVAISESSPEGPLSPPALRESIRRAQAQVEDAIAQALGHERYAVYRDYERSVAPRTTVAQLEQRLSYSGAPLSPAQADSLVQILAQTAPGGADAVVPAVSIVVASGGANALPLLPAATPAGRVTDDAIIQARAVLAPAQLGALQDIQIEQQAALRAAELVRQSSAAGDAMKDLGLTLLLQ
jgi:hypothetical protein